MNAMPDIQILTGDCREVLKGLPDASIDSCVTDPPYELGFMGKAWDKTGIAYDAAMWREVLRVLKPGGHLLSFGGTRTYHRMTCAIEDAGFEIRDQIGWAYGSGFPKSLDVSKAIDKAARAEREVVGTMRTNVGMQGGNFTAGSQSGNVAITTPATDAAKQWDGWGTALKPAWEPICVARKPLVGTVADNVQEHGTGALNIDACRIESGGEHKVDRLVTKQTTVSGDTREGAALGMYGAGASFVPTTHDGGRWPANLIHDGSEEVVALFPNEAGASAPVLGTEPSTPAKNVYGEYKRGGGAFHGDTGSAARFFYCAKVSPSERGDSGHPTMKPVALMRYLCRLVTPTGGRVLDPFGGSGSTAIAALEEGFSITIIEQDPDNVKLIRSRTDVTPGFAF
jgi:DNA modification methylase